jgi:hypothetical protein
VGVRGKGKRRRGKGRRNGRAIRCRGVEEGKE